MPLHADLPRGIFGPILLRNLERAIDQVRPSPDLWRAVTARRPRHPALGYREVRRNLF
jgi:hypothetical protein